MQNSDVIRRIELMINQIFGVCRTNTPEVSYISVSATTQNLRSWLKDHGYSNRKMKDLDRAAQEVAKGLEMVISERIAQDKVD